MVQPQMDQDRFRNISNLNLVKPNESGTRHILALDCYLLTCWCWKCPYMHFPFDDIRYPLTASSNVDYFLFYSWCEVWFTWNKQKQQSKCYTRTESSPENVPRPKRSDVGLERSMTRTWSSTDTSYSKVAKQSAWFKGASAMSKFTWNDYSQPYTVLQFTLMFMETYSVTVSCSQWQQTASSIYKTLEVRSYHILC